MLLLSSSCHGKAHSYESDNGMAVLREENSRSEAQLKGLDPSTASDIALEDEREVPIEKYQQIVQEDSTGGDEEEESEEDESGDDDWISDDEVDASDCWKCRDDQRNRHAWGLLLTESEQRGKFIQVGTFTSRAREAGGMKYLDAKEFVRMEII